MRINHNITAMNSYRNFSANGSKLSKNLEKVSTGMRINRAGDDAAGLAISEKMRAQISGITGAEKNAKDGISLIQTAEGALTEVHDMLNRMTTLAEQSANGTYDNDVDRNQLQKEVDALKSEIDRIADSTNYNGIKLLDGSLSGGGNISKNITTSDIEATKAVAYSSVFAAVTREDGNALEEGDKLSYTISWKDGNDKEYSTSIEFTIGKSNATGAANNSALIASDGTKYVISGGAGNPSKVELQDAVVNELNKNDDFKANFVAAKATAGEDITNELANGSNGTTATAGTTADMIKFTSREAGTSGPVVSSVEMAVHEKQSDGTFQTSKIENGSDVVARYNATDAAQQLNLKNIRILNSDDASATDGRVAANTFEVGGKKFVLYAGAEDGTIDQLVNKFNEKVGGDVTVIQLNGGNSASTAGATYATSDSTQTIRVADFKTDAETIAGQLKRVTGMDFGVAQLGADGKVDTTDGEWQIVLKGNTKLTTGGKSLDLQIGDTADSFNTLSVSVEDMHAASIGIGDVDISSQKGAAAALDQIKSAVNYVSNTRGTLGALQNRLDHTINNLGVMKENITSSESLIRDTDVAEEMMNYTKNNILNQAAQAMLAQANQLPQGVLQLLG